jgi:two-component system, OmpR family, alkaline phosphatase synthesis response regulator PhoP
METSVRPSSQLDRGLSNSPTLLQFGPLEIDETAREVRAYGKSIQLKPREFSLLLTLASNAGVAMSRERLLETVWGYDFDGGDRTLDVHIRRLRMKIEENARCGTYLHTLRRFGYKFSYACQNNPRFTVRVYRSSERPI